MRRMGDDTGRPERKDDDMQVECAHVVEFEAVMAHVSLAFVCRMHCALLYT